MHWISMIELVTGFSVILLSICFILVIVYPLSWLTAKKELIVLLSGFTVIKVCMFIGIIITPPYSELLNILALPIVLLLGPMTSSFANSTLHLKSAVIFDKTKTYLISVGYLLLIPLFLNSMSLEVLDSSGWFSITIKLSLGLFVLLYIVSSSYYFVPMQWKLLRGTMYGVGYSEATNNWLKGIWLSMSMTWLIILSDLIISIFYYEPTKSNVAFSILHNVPPLHSAIFSVLDLVVWLILLGFTTAYCRKPIDEKEIELSESAKKYRTSALSQEQAQSIIKNLNELMEQHSFFLDSQISLEKLAKKASVRPDYLSQSINQVCQLSFYEYLASYRIEFAKKELLSHPKKNILDVAMQSGFNSKSTFNLTFKKLTGSTPSNYRNQCS